MGRRVELLAPAGNYEAFLGAVNAGADAVYLGGQKFGARAYADNFTMEEICQAIHTAHFMGRKIYLTVNTLLKEKESAQLYDYLLPFYEAGLDGVIVQDIGVLRYIRRHFKDLALHASTQMTITGERGAAMIQESGVERIVPARELSLEEIQRIKEKTGLEIECFIHGAMCYCYSGQCLFSSILGGRSGNRGRCAQPCRLPYQIYDGAEKIEGVEYPLSLKDMCTLAYIPRLIEAGIDSFKIEGRMKKPEYAAGVTAIYRKYIDLYEQKGVGGYRVEEEDIEKLRSLYMRSEIQTGYYERHNGREMVTLHKPGYAGNDSVLLDQIREQYVHEPDKHPVRMHALLKTGEPAELTISGICMTTIGQERLPQEITVTVQGAVVEAARKMPLEQEHIRKQLLKTGNSLLTVSECEIITEGGCFLPVSALNELRRMGTEAYERQYIMAMGLTPGRTMISDEKPEEYFEQIYSMGHQTPVKGLVDITVSTVEQLTESVKFPCRRIYIDSDLYIAHYEQITACMREHNEIEYGLALPYVLRAKDAAYLQRLSKLLGRERNVDRQEEAKGRTSADARIMGFLVRNLEGASYVKDLEDSYEIVPDAGLYVFQKESVRFWAQYCREYTLPYELNQKEAGQLVQFGDSIGMNTALIVYSRIPMMVTANCFRKTAGRCMADEDMPQEYARGNKLWIRDRYGTDFPVLTNCTHCYNIIYNSVPYSLHLQEREIEKIGVGIRRYDFTMESAGECGRILAGDTFPYESYTTGHLKRGVD